ncbi:hypothetical protein IQ243_20435 [Nostocales cyanobacterium LEGE 11386]|nr:hypothetical protein [Nostocales cyanobacterium LEGE 11386]
MANLIIGLMSTILFLQLVGLVLDIYWDRKNRRDERLQQNKRREQKYQELMEGCQGCKYFHGKDGIICTPHPRGQMNCPDYKVIRRAG